MSSERKLIAVGGVVLAVILVVMAFSIRSFGSTIENAQDGVAPEGPEVADGLDVHLTVTNVDPVKGDMSVRVKVDPLGSYKDQDDTLAKPVSLFFSTDDGTKQVDFKPGKPVGSTDLTIPLIGDSVSKYPLDSTVGDVELKFTTVGEKPATTPSTPAETGAFAGVNAEEKPASSSDATKAPTATASDEVVPTQVTIYKNVPAYSVVDAAAAADHDGVQNLTFTITRAPVTVWFSFLVTFIMWALAAGVLFICLSILLGRRKLEVGLLSMMGAILFAMPAALRGSQPGIPAPGVLSDFYGFFWCDAIVAVSLVVTILVYLKRRQAA